MNEQNSLKDKMELIRAKLGHMMIEKFSKLDDFELLEISNELDVLILEHMKEQNLFLKAASD
jgi:hypothetical protein